MKKFLAIMFMMLLANNSAFATYEVKYMNTGVAKRTANTSFGSNALWLPHNSAALAQRSREIRRYEAITDSIKNQNNYNYNYNHNHNYNYNYNNNSSEISASAIPAKAPKISRFNKEYRIVAPKTSTRNGVTYYN